MKAVGRARQAGGGQEARTVPRVVLSMKSQVTNTAFCCCYCSLRIKKTKTKTKKLYLGISLCLCFSMSVPFPSVFGTFL
jgi:hypothetical protein